MKKTRNRPLGIRSVDMPNGKSKPSIREILWTAGFLEGEGSFNLTRNSVIIQAVQKQRWPLTKLQQIFGGRVKLRKNTGLGGGLIWFWQVSGERARRVARTILPYMSPRRSKRIVQFNGL